MSQQERQDGATLKSDPDFTRKIAELEIQITSLKFTEHRIMSELSQGQNPGPASSILKTNGSETGQKLLELGVEAIGFYASPDQKAARHPNANVDLIGPDHALTPMPRYLNFRASTIYGGSNEIQRNIMAKAVLGL